jgi:hypothetical protein
MYVFQRESKAGRIEFVGEQAAVVEFLRVRIKCTFFSRCKRRIKQTNAVFLPGVNQ